MSYAIGLLILSCIVQHFLILSLHLRLRRIEKYPVCTNFDEEGEPVYSTVKGVAEGG